MLEEGCAAQLTGTEYPTLTWRADASEEVVLVDAGGRAVACAGARGGADAVAVELRGPGGAVIRCACPVSHALSAWLCASLDSHVTQHSGELLCRGREPPSVSPAQVLSAGVAVSAAHGGCSCFVRQHGRRGSCEKAADEAGRAAGEALQRALRRAQAAGAQRARRLLPRLPAQQVARAQAGGGGRGARGRARAGVAAGARCCWCAGRTQGMLIF